MEDGDYPARPDLNLLLHVQQKVEVHVTRLPAPHPNPGLLPVPIVRSHDPMPCRKPLFAFLLVLFTTWTLTAKRADNEAATDRFFDGPILQWRLVLPPEAVASLRSKPRVYVEGQVEVGGQTYGGVGVRLKGSAGSKRSVDDRPALTLDFNRFKKGQRVFGMAKVHLNNSVQDSTYISDNLASRIYRAAGIPATRGSHALFEFNGRDLGLYVVKEAYDEHYLMRHFPGDIGRHGNLYDGGFVSDITKNLERDAGGGPTNHTDLVELRVALAQPVLERRSAIEKVLDVDRFLTFTAIQMAIDDWDGYVRNRNNYRVYFGADGRAVFLPSGMDQLFRNPNAPIRDGFSGRVASALLETSRQRLELRDRIRSLSSNVLSESWLLGQVTAIQGRIDAAVAPLPEADRDRILSQSERITPRIKQRLAVVRRELDQWPDPMPPREPGTRQSLSDARWEIYTQTGRSDTHIGHPWEGRDTIHFQALEPRTRATVRTTVMLPAGRYRFSGMARASGVEALTDDLGIGVGLRQTGVTGTSHLEGDTDWSRLTHDFDLGEDGTVEFIVELKAQRGEAWFDRSTLTLETLATP
jgi:spore coat protein H